MLAHGTPAEPAGITVDIAREVGARLGLPVELVCFDAARRSYEAMAAGRADICFLAIEPARASEIAEMIYTVGGQPIPRSVEPEEQYLAFLSLKFLLPKLVDAKKLTIRRYENTLNTLRSIETAPDEVSEVLRRHVADHRGELKVLERATEQVLAGK